ncbi:MAG: MATE family efflux transporter [Xanthomonadales bacterium]|nr:MATE family efflux transporter [Xanthomonadales bacterium]
MTLASLRAELAAVLRLALPLAAAQLALMGMGVVETWLAGRHGTATLAAIAIGAAVWSLAVLALLGVLMAVPAFVGEAHGAGRRERVPALLGQALWLALLLALPLALLLGAAGAWLAWIGIAPPLAAAAGEFLRALAPGVPGAALFMVLRGTAEGLSLTVPTLLAAAGGAALLLPLGALALFGLGDWPGLGLPGLGLAHALVLWLQALSLLWLLRRRAAWRAGLAGFRPSLPAAAELAALLRVGLPMAVTVLLEGALFVASGSAGRPSRHRGRGRPPGGPDRRLAGLHAPARAGDGGHRARGPGPRRAGRAAAPPQRGRGAPDRPARPDADRGAAAARAGAAWPPPSRAIRRCRRRQWRCCGWPPPSSSPTASRPRPTACCGASRTPAGRCGLCALAYWGVGMPVGALLAFPVGKGILGLWIGLAAGLTRRGAAPPRPPDARPAPPRA